MLFGQRASKGANGAGPRIVPRAPGRRAPRYELQHRAALICYELNAFDLGSSVPSINTLIFSWLIMLITLFLSKSRRCSVAITLNLNFE